MRAAGPSGTLNLDWFSPLPPQRSGISDYAVDLLPHLERHADVRVVRPTGVELSAEFASSHEMISPEAIGEGGRTPLYQMGNNGLHAEIERWARHTPGIVTLHDLVLHHLLLGETLGQGDFPGYVERLTAEHGWVGDRVARGFGWGFFADAAQFALAAHRTLLRAQRGVLVHSEWAARILEEEMPGLTVRVVPMAVPLPPAIDPATAMAARQRLGIPLEARVLGSVGFQTPIKRTATAIRALAQPALGEAWLIVAGEAAIGLDFERLAREAGVADRVRVLGYQTFDRLEETIAACDLCINLRYPSAGETSASLLRILAAGRTAVVSDFAQFRDLPESVVLHVPLGEEEEQAFASAVGRLLGDPPRLAAMGVAARRLVASQHDPDRAARLLVAACQEVLACVPTTNNDALDAARTAHPPSSWVADDLSAEIAVQGIEAPWPPGSRRRVQITLSNRGFATWSASRRGAGGVAVAVRLDDESGRDLSGVRGWWPLERDVEPGGSYVWDVTLRRPLGAAWLRLEPRVFERSRIPTVGPSEWRIG